MKLLQVAPRYYPMLGGVERHVQGVSEHLAALQNEVTVATVDPTGKLPKRETLNGVQIRRFRGFGRGEYIVSPGLLRFLLQHGRGYDAIHAYNYHALPLLFAALTNASRCVVSPCYHHQAHDSAANRLHKIYDPIARRVLRKMAGVICLSKGEAREVSRDLGIPRERIEVIPSGVDLCAVNAPTTSLRLETEERVILSVGRLERYKHVERVVKAMLHMPAEYVLKIVGAGPEAAKLRQMARVLGVDTRVRLLGGVSDSQLRALYNSASVVVSMSEAESFGITVLEALAHGKRVVCSNIPAFTDFKADFPRAVTLVEAGANAKDLAEQIVEAAKSPAGPGYLRKYSWNLIAVNHVRVYCSVGTEVTPLLFTGPLLTGPLRNRVRN